MLYRGRLRGADEDAQLVEDAVLEAQAGRGWSSQVKDADSAGTAGAQEQHGLAACDGGLPQLCSAHHGRDALTVRPPAHDGLTHADAIGALRSTGM